MRSQETGYQTQLLILQRENARLNVLLNQIRSASEFAHIHPNLLLLQ